MPYIMETCVAGRTYEVCKYYSYRYHAKGEKRSRKEKPSSDAQKKVNQRKAEKELRRSMNENFQDGDSLVRLDFSKENYPVGSDEIQKAMSSCLKKLREVFRKKGRELKYIYVKEIGKRGGRHVHIIMSKVDTDTLMECWPFGGIHLDPLISNGQYAKIAAYFIKYAAKTEETEGKLIGKRWNPSRNLRRPVPKKEIVPANTYRERSFKKLAGYYLDKDSVQEGISEFTGYGYFSYTLIQADGYKQIQQGEDGQGRKRKRRKRARGKREKEEKDRQGRGRLLDRVNIYTYTDIRGLKPRDGTAWYIIEAETSKGPATAGDKLRLEQVTENRAELTALLKAARRVKTGCELHIYTESAFVAAGWTMGWISGWKKNDWRTRKGDQVAFCEMWQELDQIISCHHTEFHVGEHHAYSAWFKFEAERERKKSYVREIRGI